MPAGFVVAVIVLFIALAVWQAVAARKRRESLAVLAARLGLRFDSSRRRDLARQYRFLDKLARGSNRYAYNVLEGRFRGQDVHVFDYHYETHSSDSQGRSRTHHHRFSFFVLSLPRAFPELTIAREGFLSKVAQSLGYDDIDFESHEFSRRFCVRSRDKKFAYDICHARMIEYLLANPDLTIEIDRTALSLAFDRCLSPDAIEANLQRLVAVRELMPSYLFHEEGP